MKRDSNGNERQTKANGKSGTLLTGTQPRLFEEDSPGTGIGGGADWGAVDPRLLCELVSTVTSRGGAVRFGYSRDGGAYALGLYYGGSSKTVYCSPHDDPDAMLGVWIAKYSDLPNSYGVSPAVEGQKTG